MKTFEEIMADIRKLYNKEPKGWQISVNRDKFNHGNILITNPSSLWQVKLDSLFRPNPLSVGGKLEDIDISEKVGKNLPSFGYRPLGNNQLAKMQENLMSNKSIDSLILDILQKDPVPIDNTKNQGFIEGPINLAPPGYISNKQKKLDLKLKKDLNKLKYRRGLGLQYL